MKVLFYFLAFAIEELDEDVKKKGIVVINWRVHNPPVPTAALFGPMLQIWRCIPNQIFAFHTCYAPITALSYPAFEIISKLVSVSAKNQGYNFENHCGTAMEVEYELRMKHAIPTECFPYDPWATDFMHNHHHKAWVNRRNIIDQKKAELYIVSRRSSVSITQVLQSLRTSDQSMNIDFWNDSIMNIDFWNDSIGFSMESDEESMIGSNTAADSNHGELMSLSIASQNSFDEDSSASLDNMSVNSGINDPNEPNSIMAVGDDKLRNGYSETSQLRDDSDDIKLGRGKALQRHPGNIWLKALVSKEFEKYDSLDRNEQTKYATALVTKIKGTGRRFLEKSEENAWIEVGDLEARPTVASRFRNESKRRLEKNGSVE